MSKRHLGDRRSRRGYGNHKYKKINSSAGRYRKDDGWSGGRVPTRCRHSRFQYKCDQCYEEIKKRQRMVK